MNWETIKASPEYQKYHHEVVEACVRNMGEQVRDFFNHECDYLDEFKEGTPPDEVAQEQRESL